MWFVLCFLLPEAKIFLLLEVSGKASELSLDILVTLGQSLHCTEVFHAGCRQGSRWLGLLSYFFIPINQSLFLTFLFQPERRLFQLTFE